MLIDGETRKYAAALGRRYFDGTVTMDAIFEHFGDTEDPLIQELLIAIAHEPRRGFFGIRESRWQKSFWLPVSKVLAELERGHEGRVPEDVIVGATGWALLGFALLIVWAGASAAEHALALWRGVEIGGNWRDMHS